MDSPHLGVLAGIRAEADALIQHLPRDLQVTVRLSAAQPDRARQQADALVAAGVTHLLSFGYAGGLDPALRPGMLVVPRSVTGPDGATYGADGDWLGQAMTELREFQPLAAGHLGVDRPISEAEAKSTAFLRSRGAVRAVDMESHVLAALAQARALPFLAVRVILDSSEHDLPPAAMTSVRPDGSLSMIKLAGSVALHPVQLAALSRLSQAQRAAAKALLRCCRRGGPTGFGVR